MDTETTLEFLKLFAAEIRRIQAVDPSLKPLAPPCVRLSRQIVLNGSCKDNESHGCNGSGEQRSALQGRLAPVVKSC